MENLVVSVSNCHFDYVIRYLDSYGVLHSMTYDVGRAIDWSGQVGRKFKMEYVHGAETYKFSEQRYSIPDPIPVNGMPLGEEIKIEDIRDDKIVCKTTEFGLDTINTFSISGLSVINPLKVRPGNYLYKCSFGCGIPITNKHLSADRKIKCPHTGDICTAAHWRAIDGQELASLTILEKRNKTSLPHKTGRVVLGRSGRAR